MSGQYAKDTTVAVEKSRGEIERTLARYGATAFAYGWDQERAMLQFEADHRMVRFLLPLPDRNAVEFQRTPSRGFARSDEQVYAAWEQACRQRWRALALVVKAKLEAVSAGISEFEDEFLAHIVLPDGSTAGQWMRPQIAAAYETSRMPPMLALGGGSGPR